MAQSVNLWGATYSDVPAIEVPKSGGGMASFTDVTDTTAIASDVLSGKYFYTAAGEKTLGTGSGGGGAQELTGTFTGNGGISVQIPCNFAPNLIYVHGDLSGSVTLRGVISITLIKDTALYLTADTSQSSTDENLAAIAHGFSGYNESNPSDPHATYSNGVLTINNAENTSSKRFASGVTYNYKLVGWS